MSTVATKRYTLKDIPTSGIDFIVGRLHVGTPDAEIVADMEKRAKDWPAGARKLGIKYALDRHHKNQGVYSSVMGGSSRRGRAGGGRAHLLHTFRSLPVGTVFHFASEKGVYSKAASGKLAWQGAHGPWIKTGARKYRSSIESSTEYTVGKVSVKVDYPANREVVAGRAGGAGAGPKYLSKKIAEVRHAKQPMPQLTRDGYSKRSGSPTATMIRLEGEKVWRRVYVWQFSNASTAFVRVNGQPFIVTDLDRHFSSRGAAKPRGKAGHCGCEKSK